MNRSLWAQNIYQLAGNPPHNSSMPQSKIHMPNPRNTCPSNDPDSRKVPNFTYQKWINTNLLGHLTIFWQCFVQIHYLILFSQYFFILQNWHRSSVHNRLITRTTVHHMYCPQDLFLIHEKTCHWSWSTIFLLARQFTFNPQILEILVQHLVPDVIISIYKYPNSL